MKAVSVADILNVINNSEKLDISEEQLDEKLPDLGMDSITFIQIIVGLEEVFDCEIPDSKLLISEMDTVQKMFNVLQELYETQSLRIDESARKGEMNVKTDIVDYQHMF